MNLNKLETINLVVASILSSCLYGCFTAASLQSPKILEKDKSEFLIGSTVNYSRDSIYVHEVLLELRKWADSDKEVGLRLYSNPFDTYGIGSTPERYWIGTMGNVKIQLNEKFPLTALNLGGSFTLPLPTFSLYTSLITGTERVFITGKLVSSVILSKTVFYPALSLGFSIGDSVRIYPEIGILACIDASSDSPNISWTKYFSIGLAFQP
jgi:hypothetical protein